MSYSTLRFCASFLDFSFVFVCKLLAVHYFCLDGLLIFFFFVLFSPSWLTCSYKLLFGYYKKWIVGENLSVFGLKSMGIGFLSSFLVGGKAQWENILCLAIVCGWYIIERISILIIYFLCSTHFISLITVVLLDLRNPVCVAVIWKIQKFWMNA